MAMIISKKKSNYLAATSLLFAVATTYADSLIKSPLTATMTPRAENVIRGQLRARQFTTLAANLPGKLVSFPVTLGQRLSQGQTIAVFDCQMEKAEKEVAVAKLSAAQSKLQVNTQLAQYKNVSDLELTLSKADVAVQKAELNRIEAVLSKCVVTSPFAAVVSEKVAQAHQYVKEGDPLVELVDTRNLEVEMVIPSRWLKKLAAGTQFSLQLDEFATPVKAKIDRNVGTIDPVSQTIRVIGVLLNPPAALLPGMSGEVIFPDAKH
jgi:RND family efflux transporter MFP subunit